MKVFIDIETIPAQPESLHKAKIAEHIQHPASMSKPETIADWHNGAGKYVGAKDAAIDEQYRKTSFDGAKGEICSIAWSLDGNNIVSVVRDNSMTEAQLLSAFISGVGASSKPPYFIGHYVGGFDLRFIFQRCVINGINPGFEIPFRGRHNSDYYCTMQAWCGYKDTISLDNLCAALGLDGKGDIDGSMIYDLWLAGEYEKIAEYNKADVDRVIRAWRKMNFLY